MHEPSPKLQRVVLQMTSHSSLGEQVNPPFITSGKQILSAMVSECLLGSPPKRLTAASRTGWATGGLHFIVRR
jgi:hypothetical protein